MKIPEINNFEELLKSLTLRQPQSDESKRSIVAVKSHKGYNRDQKVTFPEHKIWYSSEVKLSIDALISKIQRELQLKNHVHSREVVLSLLCLFTLMPDSSETCVSRLNSFIESITSADLTQIFVLIIPPPNKGYQFRFGSFTVGTLNSQRMSYRCKKAQSDAFDRYESKLRGKLSFERDIIQVNLVDFKLQFKKCLPVYNFNQTKTFNSFADVYFREVAKEFEKDFWLKMNDDQHVTIAMGANYIDVKALRLMFWGAFYSIFMNIGSGRSGWVVPKDTYPILEFAGTNKFIPEAEHILKSHYSFTGFGSSILHQTTKSYTRFVSQARRHVWEENIDDAFLHFIIALELLLSGGTTNVINKTVSERAAVIVHRALGKTYQEQKKSIAEMYAVRSKYVHKGQPTSNIKRIELENVCMEIFRCLMRLQTNTKNQEDHFLTQWLKDLDYVSRTLESGRSITDKELKDIGIRSRRRVIIEEKDEENIAEEESIMIRLLPQDETDLSPE